MPRNRIATSTSGLNIALIGTRGVPASYGGFETAVEEVGRRLAERGHTVTVYGREAGDVGDTYLGMHRVTLPAVHKKALETPSHTAVSVVHAVTRGKPDLAFVFNAANSPFLPMLRAAGIPVALHMDGLEWKRSKWGNLGRSYYRRAEQFGVRTADALIADSRGIAEYYDHQFQATTELIKYGAPQLHEAPANGISGLGLEPNGYHLVVARFEPENHVLEIVEGYHRSRASLPLVVVGSAPYSEEYTATIEELADSDDRVRLLGAVYDQELLDAMYFHAYTYLHGHSVGGTNPSLLRAIGAGTPVIGFDVSFNRDVVDSRGWFFTDATSVATAIEDAESSPSDTAQLGPILRERAAAHYTWDCVTDQYEDLAKRLHDGASVHRNHRRARRNAVEWSPGA